MISGREQSQKREGSLLPIHMLMLLSATLVSTSFNTSAAITRELDPLVLTFIRFFLATLFLGPFIWLKSKFCFSVGFLFRCAVISGCQVFFFWSMFKALRYTSALHTSIIFTLVPSIVGLYALVLLRERMGPDGWFGLFCGLVGAVWVIFRGDLEQLLCLQLNRGDLIFFSGCLVMGLYTILVRLLHRNEPTIAMTFWMLVTGCLWLLLFGFDRIVQVEVTEIPIKVWAGIVYLAFFTTIITFFLTQYSILHIGPINVMAYSYLYPSMVLGIDFMLGNGLPELKVLPGVGIVLLAMFVLLRNTLAVKKSK